MVSQGPMTPTCGFFLSRIKKERVEKACLGQEQDTSLPLIGEKWSHDSHRSKGDGKWEP